LSTGAYCDYNNTPSNSTTYGKLYNGYAVIDSRNIAPTGWHVPTDAEWTILTTYLGGESVAGGKLKETGTNHWLSPNTGATNETGFTALPGGTCRWDGSFFVLNYTGHWWSSTAGWFRDISYYYSIVERYSNSMVYGFSVRCVKD
jgi:uncharacterized protein (TIGR02145 family)